MGAMNFRDAYEFDPETYLGESGGLPGAPESLSCGPVESCQRCLQRSDTLAGGSHHLERRRYRHLAA